MEKGNGSPLLASHDYSSMMSWTDRMARAVCAPEGSLGGYGDGDGVGSVTTWVPRDLARLNQEPSERGSPPNSEKGPPSPLCDKTGLVGTPQRGGPLRVLLVDVRLRKRPYSLEQGRRHPN